jgi:hypothetical protein
VKRLVATALLAGGLLATALPAAQAAPLCGPLVNVNCAWGSHFCRVWIGPTQTCIEV